MDSADLYFKQKLQHSSDILILCLFNTECFSLGYY